MTHPRTAATDATDATVTTDATATTVTTATTAAIDERVAHWPVESVGSRPLVADGRLFYRAWNVSDVFVVG